MDVTSAAAIGDIKVFTTSGRGLNVEELSDLALRKLLTIADTAPPELREQAHQFKARMRDLLISHGHHCIRSDRTTLHNQLRGAGQREAADLVLKI